jgi:hypothetical protein
LRKLIPAVGTLTLAALTFFSPAAAQASDTSVDSASTASIQELTAEQVATINALRNAAPASAPAAVRSARAGGLNSSVNATNSIAAESSRRASYYQGSALMWSRDNVDFGFNWSKVTYSSGFQQNGWIWPNIARNDGISRFINQTAKHTWRGSNSFGAGVPTPWGDVKVYNLTYITTVNVTYNGAWQAVRS